MMWTTLLEHMAVKFTAQQ